MKRLPRLVMLCSAASLVVCVAACAVWVQHLESRRLVLEVFLPEVARDVQVLDLNVEQAVLFGDPSWTWAVRGRTKPIPVPPHARESDEADLLFMIQTIEGSLKTALPPPETLRVFRSGAGGKKWYLVTDQAGSVLYVWAWRP